MQFIIWPQSCFLAAILVFTAILIWYVIFDISWDVIYEMITRHDWLLFWKTTNLHRFNLHRFNLLLSKSVILAAIFFFLDISKCSMHVDRVSAFFFSNWSFSEAKSIQKKTKRNKTKQKTTANKTSLRQKSEFDCRIIMLYSTCSLTLLLRSTWDKGRNHLLKHGFTKWADHIRSRVNLKNNNNIFIPLIVWLKKKNNKQIIELQLPGQVK